MSMRKCFKDRKFRNRENARKRTHPGQAYASARKRARKNGIGINENLGRLREAAFGVKPWSEAEMRGL
jgi:hypothetical protein